LFSRAYFVFDSLFQPLKECCDFYLNIGGVARVDLIERVFVMRSLGAFVIAAFAGGDVVYDVIWTATAFRDEMIFGRILTA
jgi:hypothetical protein